MATQADARGRTTRTLFGKTPHLHVVKPKGSPDINHHFFTREQAFAERTPDNHRRGLCDCQSFVSHALRLRDVAYPCETPATSGIVFMRLPGLQLRPSTETYRRALHSCWPTTRTSRMVVSPAHSTATASRHGPRPPSSETAPTRGKLSRCDISLAHPSLAMHQFA